MAGSKRTKNKPYQRVHKFPAAKGKVIAEVELSISPDYRIIEIVFQDKTRSRSISNRVFASCP